MRTSATVLAVDDGNWRVVGGEVVDQSRVHGDDSRHAVPAPIALEARALVVGCAAAFPAKVASDELGVPSIHLINGGTHGELLRGVVGMERAAPAGVSCFTRPGKAWAICKDTWAPRTCRLSSPCCPNCWSARRT